MDVKSAAGEIRKAAKLFSAFAYIEEVLEVAASCETSADGLKSKVRGLQAEVLEWNEKVAAARRVHTDEQDKHQREIEHLNETYRKTAERLNAKASEAAATRERMAVETISAQGLAIKQLKAECSALEDAKAQLKIGVENMRTEYGAMLERIGVKA